MRYQTDGEVARDEASPSFRVSLFVDPTCQAAVRNTKHRCKADENGLRPTQRIIRFTGMNRRNEINQIGGQDAIIPNPVLATPSVVKLIEPPPNAETQKHAAKQEKEQVELELEVVSDEQVHTGKHRSQIRA